MDDAASLEVEKVDLNYAVNEQSIRDLSSVQLALAPLSTNWISNTNTNMSRQVVKEFRSRREKNAGSIGKVPSIECISLAWDITLPLKDLTSSQLAVIRFHPEVTTDSSDDAEEIIWQRREARRRPVIAAAPISHNIISRPPLLPPSYEPSPRRDSNHTQFAPASTLRPSTTIRSETARQWLMQDVEEGERARRRQHSSHSRSHSHSRSRSPVRSRSRRRRSASRSRSRSPGRSRSPRRTNERRERSSRRPDKRSREREHGRDRRDEEKYGPAADHLVGVVRDEGKRRKLEWVDNDGDMKGVRVEKEFKSSTHERARRVEEKQTMSGSEDVRDETWLPATNSAIFFLATDRHDRSCTSSDFSRGHGDRIPINIHNGLASLRIHRATFPTSDLSSEGITRIIDRLCPGAGIPAAISIGLKNIYLAYLTVELAMTVINTTNGLDLDGVRLLACGLRPNEVSWDWSHLSSDMRRSYQSRSADFASRVLQSPSTADDASTQLVSTSRLHLSTQIRSTSPYAASNNPKVSTTAATSVLRRLPALNADIPRSWIFTFHQLFFSNLPLHANRSDVFDFVPSQYHKDVIAISFNRPNPNPRHSRSADCRAGSIAFNSYGAKNDVYRALKQLTFPGFSRTIYLDPNRSLTVWIYADFLSFGQRGKEHLLNVIKHRSPSIEEESNKSNEVAVNSNLGPSQNVELEPRLPSPTPPTHRPHISILGTSKIAARSSASDWL